MAKIVTPSIKKIYKDLINQVIEDLNKPILAHMPPDKVDCPNSIYDYVTQKDTGKFDSSFVSPVIIFGNTITPQPFVRGRCPVCFGKGFLESAVTKNLKALVKWNPGGADDLQILPVGREGAPAVRIKVKRTNFETIKNAESFTIDGVKCELIQPPTIRGLGTQEELVVAFLLATEVGSDVKR
jgi:hypothetical protein